MKIIKTYESYNLDDLDLGRFFDSDFRKSKLTLNDDGTYDYNGDLGFSSTKVKINSLLELPIRFKNIYGNFGITFNDLISLEGSPENIHGKFWCYENKLISLQYAPSFVGGKYYNCAANNLLSKVHLSKIENYCEFDSDYNPFEITDEVISTVKLMSYEQQMAELKFFEEYDLNAYKMLQEIFIDLDIQFGSDYKKSIVKTLKGNDNLKSIGF